MTALHALTILTIDSVGRSGAFQMLRAEQNELISHTGPGTPMGELFRRYWTPALLAEQLPKNDGPPVRVKLFSERLVAFRDSKGRYGLIDEFCPHRPLRCRLSGPKPNCFD